MRIPIKEGSWRECAIKYAKSIHAEYKLSDKGHLMYTVIPDEMAKDFLEFLEKLDLRN